MAVQDDLRRLTQLDSILLGWATYNVGATVVVWYKGRLLQANDATWLFRSISGDGTIVGFQLGGQGQNWTSSENPGTGIIVQIPISIPQPAPTPALLVAMASLQQELPQGLTN